MCRDLGLSLRGSDSVGLRWALGISMFTSTPGEFYDWVILGNTLLLYSIYFVGWSSVLAGS